MQVGRKKGSSKVGRQTCRQEREVGRKGRQVREIGKIGRQERGEEKVGRDRSLEEIGMQGGMKWGWY